MKLELSQDDLVSLVRERVTALITPARAEELYREALRESIGSQQLESLAAEYGYTRESFLNFLRNHDVPLVRLSRENVRVRLIHLRALEERHELKPSRRAKPPLALHQEESKAA